MIYTVTNQKGGIGKSTTAQALAAGLVARGRTVLIIDLDAQGNTSQTFKANAKAPGAYELMTGAAVLADVIQETETSGLCVVPGSGKLSRLDLDLTETGKEYRLAQALKGVKFQDVVIDTPPALGAATVNALTAANSLIIPAQPDFYSLEAVKQLYKTVALVKQWTNKALDVTGVLLTRYNGRSALTRDVKKAFEIWARENGTRVFKASVRECTALKEAQARKTDVFKYSAKSNAAKDYKAFIDELLGA